MSKDKEWLKEEIKNNIQLKLDHRYGLMSGEYIGTHMLEAIIDQLDEPEVLMQELPVIPKFVADWIENAKGRHFSMYQAMEEYASEKMKRWLQDYYHSDIFARAWLDGYTVEKEPLTELNYEGAQLTSKIKELENLLDTLKSTFAELFEEEPEE